MSSSFTNWVDLCQGLTQGGVKVGVGNCGHIAHLLRCALERRTPMSAALAPTPMAPSESRMMPEVWSSGSHWNAFCRGWAGKFGNGSESTLQLPCLQQDVSVCRFAAIFYDVSISVCPRLSSVPWCRWCRRRSCLLRPARPG